MRGFAVQRNYGWAEAESDLRRGVRPAIVALRLGEHEGYVIEVAEQQGWPITSRNHGVVQ